MAHEPRPRKTNAAARQAALLLLVLIFITVNSVVCRSFAVSADGTPSPAVDVHPQSMLARLLTANGKADGLSGCGSDSDPPLLWCGENPRDANATCAARATFEAALGSNALDWVAVAPFDRLGSLGRGVAENATTSYDWWPGVRREGAQQCRRCANDVRWFTLKLPDGTVLKKADDVGKAVAPIVFAARAAAVVATTRWLLNGAWDGVVAAAPNGDGFLVYVGPSGDCGQWCKARPTDRTVFHVARSGAVSFVVASGKRRWTSLCVD